MSAISPWHQLRFGDPERGLLEFREALARHPSASHITELGTAYLWLGDYPSAWEHFQGAVVTYNFGMAAFYGRAGVAKWCLGETHTAMEWWQLGTTTDYADAAGGIHLPLLMYLGSILRPEALSKHDAEACLATRAADPRAENWPGPLGQFALGEIDLPTLEKLARNRKTGLIQPERRWLITFYQQVADLASARLEVKDFRILARKLADVTKPEWYEERDFLRLIWNDEFFVARYEGLQKTCPEPDGMRRAGLQNGSL